MIPVRPTRRVVAITAAALLVPLVLFWRRDVVPTIVVAAFALALGAWEITRHGGPKRKDLLIVVLGFVGLSFIVIVGYLASEVALHARR